MATDSTVLSSKDVKAYRHCLLSRQEELPVCYESVTAGLALFKLGPKRKQ